jgi:hypothetical protein
MMVYTQSAATVDIMDMTSLRRRQQLCLRAELIEQQQGAARCNSPLKKLVLSVVADGARDAA